MRAFYAVLINDCGCEVAREMLTLEDCYTGFKFGYLMDELCWELEIGDTIKFEECEDYTNETI